LSDHGLPSFSGFKALRIVRATHPNLPFIFVSGSNDQGMVTKMYDEGATDYVYKRDIGDLKSVVLRALRTQAPEVPIVVRPETNLTMPVSRSQFSTVSPIQSRDSSEIARLWFCSQCRRVWDKKGKTVRVEDSCDGHTGVVILRQLCAECD